MTRSQIMVLSKAVAHSSNLVLSATGDSFANYGSLPDPDSLKVIGSLKRFDSLETNGITLSH